MLDSIRICNNRGTVVPKVGRSGSQRLMSLTSSTCRAAHSSIGSVCNPAVISVACRVLVGIVMGPSARA
eukprot:773535-Rhodomonas_salina.1